MLAGVMGVIGARAALAATPRATDLLRAETLAERARQRLKLPARSGPGWRHGGAGWGDEPKPPPPPASLTIKVAPPRKRTERE
jgi:hypothetical protein